jgi:diguanylate cyclase (GGDEF)-like protein/PAS domain S-box-containing protein
LELESFGVLDTAPEEEFDAITRLVAASCDAPVALLNFIDADRQWFKSRVGVCVSEASYETPFCSRAIADPNNVFIVPDTLLDPQFTDNPLATREPHIRFYAAAPIVSATGFALGTLCVIDTKPRILSEHQLAILRAGAASVMDLLTYRRTQAALRHLAGKIEVSPEIVQEPAFMGLESAGEIPMAIIDALPGVFFVLDGSGRLLLWNKCLERASGYQSKELRSLPATDLFEMREVSDLTDAISRCVIEGEAQIDVHLRARERKSVPYFFTVSAVEYEGQRCVAGMGIDVSERKRAEELLEYTALHDPLTGLANRALLQQRLSDAIGAAEKRDCCVAIMCLGLDRFKNVNETLGYASGNELLKAIGRRLEYALRASDTVARLDGDEFVIIAEVLTQANATALATKITGALRRPFHMSGVVVHVTAGIGISLSSNDGTDGAGLLHKADMALHEAKKSGAGTHCYFATWMSVAANRRSSTERDLRSALGNDEFELFYQPTIDMGLGHAVAAEALIRWNHPKRGLLPPSEFIDIAEETGLIIPIGTWVLQQGAREAKRLATLGLASCLISVNVSGRQLRDPAFTDHMRSAIRGLDLEPGTLGIEITESAALGDPDAALVALNACKALGLHVLLDDFGTHYSSLTYLKKFPIDVIKIDKSFVDGLPSNPDDSAIVKAIIGLSGNLNCLVVAEGIENQAQASWLLQNGCAIGTGYLFAKPMPAAAFEAWLIGHAHASCA